MLIKFLKHSKGSGRAAINYLLGEKDHKGEVRAGVTVLRGDPYLTADLIDSLDSVHRYTSSVIAWHPSDKPGADEIETVLSDFERVAFAGLEPDQFTYCAVLHRDNDGTDHVHIVNPRVELRTGNSLNIAPPGHEHYFKHWRDAWNSEKGWSSPADVRLTRSPAKKELPEWKLQRFTKEIVQEFLVQNLTAGAFSDRNEMISYLNRFGEVTRVGKDYVSFKPKDKDKSIRLKGALFSEGWKFSGVEEKRIEPNKEKADEHRRKLDAMYLKRTSYNEVRFRKSTTEEIEIIADLNDKDVLNETTDSYPESIARAIESAAKFNHQAAEYYRKIEESGFEYITDRAKQSVEDSKRQINKTDRAIDAAKESIDDVGKFVKGAEKQLSIFGESVKIIGKFISRFKTGVKNMLSMNKKQEMQLIINVNEARNKLEKEKKEENILKEREEFFDILEEAVSAADGKDSSTDKLLLQNEALRMISDMNQDAQKDRVVEYLMEKNSSIGFRDAAMQVDALIHSGSEEALAEYGRMLMRSVIDDITFEKQVSENPKVESSREIRVDFDGPER